MDGGKAPAFTRENLIDLSAIFLSKSFKYRL